MEEIQANPISPLDESKKLPSIFLDGWETLDLVEEHPDPNSIEYKVLNKCYEHVQDNLTTCQMCPIPRSMVKDMDIITGMFITIVVVYLKIKQKKWIVHRK